MSFAGRSEYDRSVGCWSPDGRLFQIEYAMEAIKLGSTAIGMVTKEGVVLAVEKKIPNTLIVPSSMEKIFEIDGHMGCAMSGLIADARTLVDHARNEAQNHWFTYDEPMSVESCVSSISELALDFSDVSEKKNKTMSRPFGVALLIAGMEPSSGEPVLWMSDPSGTYMQYNHYAIGCAQEGANSLLNEQYKPDMTFKEAETLAMTILRQMMEEKMSKTNVEVASVMKGSGKYKFYKPAEIEALISALPASTLPTL